MKIKFLKAHPKFAYFDGDVADLEPEYVQELVESGCAILFPGVDEMANVTEEEAKAAEAAAKAEEEAKAAEAAAAPAQK